MSLIRKDGDVIRRSELQDERMYDVIEQDIQPYLDDAAIRRSTNPQSLSQNKYKADSFGCVYAATIPLSVVEQMRVGQCCADGKQRDLMSPDPEESKAALVHVQQAHPDLLIVNGKPFAKKVNSWH